MEIFYWVILFLSIYSYLIYPLVLIVLPKRRKNIKSAFDERLPNVSIIISAHNEEEKIQEKITNTMDLDYPDDKLQILIASDASNDDTNKIVLTFSEYDIELIDVKDRKGKENAQLQAINHATGEIIVFSDVGTYIPSEALKLMMAYFVDERVGAVSSEDRFFTSNGSIEGEGAYVKYEMWLRHLESQVHSIVGLSGSFFAARKEIIKLWDVSVPSDFNTALNCNMNGKVAISAPDVHGYYKNIKDSGQEYRRKYRTALRGIAAVVANPIVLNPFYTGLFSFEIFSHKVMRWLAPLFFLLLLIINLLLLNKNVLYQILFSGQILLYFLAFLGASNKKLRNYSIVKIAYYFVQVNMALVKAIYDFVRGKRIHMWNPSER